MTVLEKEERKGKIVSLVENYYRQYDFLHYEPLMFLVNKALDRFLETDLSIEQIEKELEKIVLEKKEAMQQRYGREEVVENHKVLYEQLGILVKLLNQEDIDFQITGSLSAYLKSGEESTRTHDDIDLYINEDDFEKFQNVCEKMNLVFEDNRLDSPRVLQNGIPVGEHEVIATKPDSDFHIGVFCFERLVDGNVIFRSYYHDEDNDPCVREEIIGKDLAKEILGKEKVTFQGESFYITPPEYVYLLKRYTNHQKDQHDIRFVEERLDPEVLGKLHTLSQTEKFVQYAKLERESELEEEEEEYEEEDDFEEEMETKKGNAVQKKVLKKKANRRGSISLSSIILTLLIIIALILLGLIAYMMFLK